MDPHFFAYNDGADCCDANTESDGDPIQPGSDSCSGDSVACPDSGTNCQDASENTVLLQSPTCPDGALEVAIA